MYCQQRRVFACSLLSSNLLDGICNAALLLVFTAVFYQYWAYGQNDPYHCGTLLNHGNWPSYSSNGQPQKYFEKWEPNGCRMVEYSRGDFHDCLGGRRVVFAGDSTIRQIYWAAATRLDHEKARRAVLDALVWDTKHQDLSFQAQGARLEFIWDPWLNSSGLSMELAKFRARETSLDGNSYKSDDDESAALVILGSPGLWAARHGGDEYFDMFKRGVDRVKEHLRSDLNHDVIRPTADLKRNYNAAPNQMLLAPVQVPWYELLSYDRMETISSERIEAMNTYLVQELQPDEQTHILWSFQEMTSNKRKAYEDNGIHVMQGVAERKLDIVLNSRCNAAGVGHRYPYKRTCCTAYPHGLVVQPALLLVGVAGLPILIWAYRHIDTLRNLLPSHNVLKAIRGILLAAAWCWFADRTQFLVKAERHYNQGIFIASCVIFMVVSLMSIRKSTHQIKQASSSGEEKEIKTETTDQQDQGFLYRDQSDEWKGWMQAVILIYHYSYGSQILWVYKIIRVLVAAYIFLSAYGHTMYLLRTGDFSLRRVAFVVFRLNALDAILAYMMMTDYSFYYFAPVVTFWYVAVWLTLRVYSRYNQDPLFVLGKVVLSIFVTSCFILIPDGPLDLFSTISRIIFGMSWKGNEARFRLALDRGIAYIGMMTASVVYRIELLKGHHVIAKTPRQATARIHKPSLLDPALSTIAFPDKFTEPMKCISCILSLCFIIFFFVITQVLIDDKTQYNIAHPYISWVPILSFLMLRNAYPVLRNSYMALPAALGKISLETYILQYHIWLGSDATAILRIGLWDRFESPLFGTWISGAGKFLEFVLMTVLFLCVSAKTRHATETLTHWLFGKERQSNPCQSSMRLAMSPETGAASISWGGSLSDRIRRARRFLNEGVRPTVCVLLLVLWIANIVYV